MFSLISLFDRAATLPTWIAAYRQGEKMFNGNEAKMVQYADMITRRTQPAASPKDLAAIQRGSEAQKLFTMFYTHFSNVYNEVQRTNKMKKLGDIGMKDALVSYWWTIIAPAMLANFASSPHLPGKKDIKELPKNVIGYGASAFPIIGGVVNTMLNKKYDYSATPTEGLPRELVNIGRAKTAGKAVRSAVKATGYAFGLPTPQLLITAKGIQDIVTGETKNPLRLFLSEYSLPTKEENVGTVSELMDTINKSYEERNKVYKERNKKFMEAYKKRNKNISKRKR